MIEPLPVLLKPNGPTLGQEIHEISLKSDSTCLKNRISIQFPVNLIEPASLSLTTLTSSKGVARRQREVKFPQTCFGKMVLGMMAF